MKIESLSSGNMIIIGNESSDMIESPKLTSLLLPSSLTTFSKHH